MSQVEAPFDMVQSVRRKPQSGLPRSAALWYGFAKIQPVLIGLLLPAFLVTAWIIAARQQWVATQILPPPAAVLQTLLGQIRAGELFGHLAISLGRVGAGFLVGGLGGVALGVAMGLSRRVEQYLYPTFNALMQVPVLGWLPLAMMLLGIGEVLKIALIAQAALIPIAVNTLRGIRAVPNALLEVAQTFRFSKRQLLHKVVLPASVPAVFVGIRYGLSQAWLSLVTVELLASSEGLGFLIVWGRQLFQLDLVLAAIVVVGVVGLALDRGLERLEAHLLRWRPKAEFGSTRRAAT